jgi:hypothetical protein
VFGLEKVDERNGSVFRSVAESHIGTERPKHVFFCPNQNQHMPKHDFFVQIKNQHMPKLARACHRRECWAATRRACWAPSEISDKSFFLHAWINA